MHCVWWMRGGRWSTPRCPFPPARVRWPISCADPRIFSCGALPEVRAELAALKLHAAYRLDKSSQVALGYVYQKLLSSDYYYNGLAYGYNPNSLLATNQVAPNYEVQVVALSYLFNF